MTIKRYVPEVFINMVSAPNDFEGRAFVEYADHVAAVEEEGRSWQKAIEETLDERDRAVAAERARIKQAVEGIANDDYCYDCDCRMKAKFLSIIDGEDK